MIYKIVQAEALKKEWKIKLLFVVVGCRMRRLKYPFIMFFCFFNMTAFYSLILLSDINLIYGDLTS